MSQENVELVRRLNDVYNQRAFAENAEMLDIFAAVKESSFVGRPFHFDYATVKILCNDAWKFGAGGVPAGAFLLGRYDNEKMPPEIVLLRVLGPTALPSDPDVVAAMVEHYKEPETSARLRRHSQTPDHGARLLLS